MIVNKNYRYARKHVIGGSGIFDTIAKIFSRVASSAVAKKVGETASKAIASKFVQSAVIPAAKAAASKAASELVTHGVNKLADVVTQKGKSAIDIVGDKILTPKSEETQERQRGFIPNARQISNELLSKKVNEIITRYSNVPKHDQHSQARSTSEQPSVNINRLLSGMGMNPRKLGERQHNAISIQDLVKKLNKKGGGMKII